MSDYNKYDDETAHQRFDDNDFTNSTTGIVYNVTAIIIFALVSFTFLFPSNYVIPLDRRSVAILGATLRCNKSFS
jgi:hypothetical protein